MNKYQHANCGTQYLNKIGKLADERINEKN